jgi:ribosomal protein L32
MPFDDDPGSEAEYLTSQGRGEDDGDLLDGAAETRRAMRRLYDKAKAAPVGSRIVCPTCGKRHSKTSYQKVFCRNTGRGNCKDRYWNTVDEVRSIKAGGARLW